MFSHILWQLQVTIDLASKVSVPIAPLRVSESESYISASAEAMVVVRCVAKHRDYGKEKPWFLY